ncbi:a-factor receptor [Lambiella insularis]|nr:a-factor receptor [Lambiella insularis]
MFSATDMSAAALRAKFAMADFQLYVGIPPLDRLVLILSLLVVILNLPVAVFHIRSRHVASSVLLVWIITLNIMNIMNAAIWDTDNTEEWFDGNILCDAEVKLAIASTGSISGSVLCIMRNLYEAFSTNRTSVSGTSKERRKRIIIEFVCCLGPCIIAPLAIVVQPSRYYIFAIAGCDPSVDNSWPTILLVLALPCVLCLASTIYGILLIIRMCIYRHKFAAILASSANTFTKTRFWRLFLVAFAGVFVVSILQGVAIYENLTSTDFHPFNFAAIHEHWDEKIMIPTGGVVVFDRWMRIGMGFFVFVCFGIGGPIVQWYKTCIRKVSGGKLCAPRGLPTASDSFTSTAPLMPQPTSKAKSLVKAFYDTLKNIRVGPRNRSQRGHPIPGSLPDDIELGRMGPYIQVEDCVSLSLAKRCLARDGVGADGSGWAGGIPRVRTTCSGPSK